MPQSAEVAPVRSLQKSDRLRLSLAGYSFLFDLALAIGIRLLLIAFLAPGSDVYYYDLQAAQALLSGANPYTHTFTGVPPSLLTPGAEKVFAYLPFTAIYLVPFYALGDVRLGFLAADLIVGIALYKLGGRWSPLSSLSFLLLPSTIIFSTVYINNSLVSMAFLALFTLFEKQGNRLASSVSLGISLASIQLVWVMFPLLAYYFLRNGRARDLVLSLSVTAIITLPFALWSFPDLIRETFLFQFARPTLTFLTQTGPLGFNLNPSLSGILVTLTGIVLPFYVKIGAMLIVLPFLIRKARDLRGLLSFGGIYLLISVFVLPNNFFWDYTELPFLVLLAHLSLSSVPNPNA